jgi:hypothetical protein
MARNFKNTARLSLITISILLFVLPLFAAAENGEEDNGLLRYVPYAVAVAIYLVSKKLSPKKGADGKPISKDVEDIMRSSLKTDPPNVGISSSNVNYGKYSKNYKPIEPKSW